MGNLVDDYVGNEKTTGKLSINGKVNGKLQRGYDEDWFAVTLEAGVTYYLTGSNPASIPGFAVGIFDPVFDAVVAAGGGGDDKELSLEFTPATSGTYYAMAIEARGNFATTSYSLGIAPRVKPDDLESSAHTSGVLKLDKPAQGVLEQRGDVDWIKFHAKAGFHYTFTIEGEATGNPAGGPFPFFNVVDAWGRSANSVLWGGFDPVSTGDYYLAVGGATNSATGAYTIKAQQVRDDFAGHHGTVGYLAAGSQVAGSFDFNMDYDWLRLDVEEGKYYTIKFNSSPDFVFGMQLKDGGENRLADISGYIRGDSLQMTYQAKKTESVFLQLDRQTYRDVDPTAYKISMTSSVDDIGQDAASAGALGFGAAAQGRLQMGTDRDAFKISLEAGVSYRFNLASSGGSEYLKLEAASANGGPTLVSKQVGPKGGLEFTPTASGEYLVTVTAGGGVAPDLAYALTAERTVDDWSANSAGAGQLMVGSSAGGMLENPDDRDWFAVSLKAGTTYWLSAKSGVSGCTLRILDAAGQALGGYTVPHNGEPLSFKPDTDGTYYVEFSSNFKQTTSYLLSAAVGTPDDTGNTIAAATALAYSAAVNASLEVGSDRDVFRLDVIAGETYAVKLIPPQYSSMSTKLSDASGAPLTGLTPATQYSETNPVFVAQYTGAVYATVRGFDAGAYQIEARTYHDDHPDQASAATQVLAEGSSITGIFEHSADRDVIRLSLDAHRSYAIVIKNATPGGPAPAYQLISSVSSPAVEQVLSNGERMLKIVTSTAGDYFLELRSANLQGTPYTVTALPFQGDGAGPSLVAQSHANNATGLSLTERTITLKFSEEIVVDRSAIILRDSKGEAVHLAHGKEFYPTVKGDTLTVMVESYFQPGSYTLAIPANAIHDKQGNRYSGPESISFTTTLASGAAGEGNGIYVAKPGTVIDGGPGIDTFIVNSASAFTHVLPYGDEFVVLNMLSGNRDTIRNIERLQFGEQIYALDVDGNAGQVYRLYQAAFNRVPDQTGLGFWIGHRDGGLPLQTVAQAFVESSEFRSLYGSALSNTAFLQAVYQNVLHRSPDAAGLHFWTDALQSGASRPSILVDFSESVENKAALASLIGDGFSYLNTWMT